MVSIEDIEHLEVLYAQGQSVKAIHECRLLALKTLPGHVERLNKYLAKQEHRFGSEVAYAEEYVFNLGKPESSDAAEVLAWCAKWQIGTPETHTSGIFKGQVRQTHIVRTREDFAQNAFIALRRLYASASATPPNSAKASSKEMRQNSRLERFYVLGGTVKEKHGEPTFHGVLALNQEISKTDQTGKDPKTIREDLRIAYQRKLRWEASGQIFSQLSKRTPT